jgi:hypothetical protein
VSYFCSELALIAALGQKHVDVHALPNHAVWQSLSALQVVT